MRLLIAIAALLASVLASAGELDGKAITCERPRYDRPKIVEFRDGGIVGWDIRVEDTQAIVAESDYRKYPDSDYEVSPTGITWTTIVVFRNRLDRETLELVSTMASDEAGDSPTVWQCEVIASLDDLQKMLEELRAVKQAEIDEEMKDNKI